MSSMGNNNKKRYVSISEFARMAGVSRQAIYARLDGDLSGFCKIVNRKRLISTAALALFDVKDVVNEGVNDFTFKEEGIETLKSLAEALKKELDAKNGQIEAQLRLIDQQQRLHGLAIQEMMDERTKRIEAENEIKEIKETARESEESKESEMDQMGLLNGAKLTQKEHQRLLWRLMPNLGMSSTKEDREEMERILSLMSEGERHLLYMAEGAKEDIERMRARDFDAEAKEEGELNELKKSWWAKLIGK